MACHTETDGRTDTWTQYRRVLNGDGVHVVWVDGKPVINKRLTSQMTPLIKPSLMSIISKHQLHCHRTQRQKQRRHRQVLQQTNAVSLHTANQLTCSQSQRRSHQQPRLSRPLVPVKRPNNLPVTIRRRSSKLSWHIIHNSLTKIYTHAPTHDSVNYISYINHKTCQR